MTCSKSWRTPSTANQCQNVSEKGWSLCRRGDGRAAYTLELFIHTRSSLVEDLF